MLEYDWENSIGYWICSTSHALRKTLGTHLTKEGMTLRQWETLAWLACNGCGSQSMLAEGLGIDPHTLAGVINRMERDGLLERHCCEHDRRKNIIQPTKKAEEVWARVSKVCNEIRAQAVAEFTDDELAQLRDFCKRIKVNLNETEPPAVQRRTAPAVPERKPARSKKAERVRT